MKESKMYGVLDTTQDIFDCCTAFAQHFAQFSQRDCQNATFIHLGAPITMVTQTPSYPVSYHLAN
jgi:hypothetical protein